MDNKLYVACHRIHEGTPSKPIIRKPGTVFIPDANNVDAFLKGGAIRRATEAEVALYEKKNRGKGNPAVAPTENEPEGDPTKLASNRVVTADEVAAVEAAKSEASKSADTDPVTAVPDEKPDKSGKPSKTPLI